MSEDNAQNSFISDAKSVKYSLLESDHKIR
jgi:hypothetical protein